MKERLLVLGGATLGLLLIAAGFAVWTRPVQIVIPAGAGYPETTMIFHVGRFGGDRAIARVTGVHFASPEWAAKLTGGRWKRSAGGTYMAFTCEASSTACMQATKGTGSYRYVLYPFTDAAPAKAGQYSLVWDVQPPGDTLIDSLILDETNQPPTSVPEPSSLVLMASGVAMLGGSVVHRRRKQRK